MLKCQPIPNKDFSLAEVPIALFFFSGRQIFCTLLMHPVGDFCFLEKNSEYWEQK